MASTAHVRDSVRQVDETSWIIGGKHVVRHMRGPCEGEYLWKNSTDGSYYTLSDAPATLPDTAPVSANSHVRLIHDAGDASAVFSFGDALILKIKLAVAGVPLEGELETLAFLAKQKLGFTIPTVLFSMTNDNKVFLIEPRLPGKRLNEAWSDLDKNEKDLVVGRVASVCLQLRTFQSGAITAVDHNWLDPKREDDQRDYRPEALEKHCEELGMDCSTFVLSHNDLGPTNILVDGDKIAIIDWELAGYSPLAWVRTKFAICGVLNTESVSDDGVKRDKEYRVMVEQKLRDLGFPEVTEAYEKLEKARSEEWIKRRPWLQ
ncbi:Uu.00g109230.m01.CDS01 [Anthostomella pinea]|uniref:Uu.00g109230.m01.CDS01 n=1 Tax=Anthostomella pinea TaxID=933095 RepID=A0AAI8VF60_9PEZI|nr:Uu.00g109230.m01.CDS01 [Anthostomella pinea]